MYKNILEHKIVQIIGPYGIVKTKEQYYFDNDVKCGRESIIYDVCIDHGNGDIVYSCNKLKDARKYIKEN